MQRGALCVCDICLCQDPLIVQFIDESIENGSFLAESLSPKHPHVAVHLPSLCRFEVCKGGQLKTCDLGLQDGVSGRPDEQRPDLTHRLCLPLVACDRDKLNKPREGRVWSPHRLFGLEPGLFLRLDVLAIVDLALLPASPAPWSGTWSRPNSESIPTVFGKSSESQARLLQAGDRLGPILDAAEPFGP